MNALYLPKTTQTDWLHMLYEYWEERDTPYQDDFDSWHNQFFKYLNEIPLCEAIESAYIMWKS